MAPQLHAPTHIVGALRHIPTLLIVAALALYLALTSVRLSVLEQRLAAHPPNRALALLLATTLTEPLVALINEARTDAPPLTLDAQLTWTAQLRADDMAAQDYYAHVNPTTHASASSILAGFGGFNTSVGENIWICADWQQCTPTLIHETFMASRAHADNLRTPAYTHVGLGFSAIREMLYIVQLFSNQSIGFVKPSSITAPTSTPEPTPNPPS